ncbi:MAG: hypothetical protein ACK5T0_07865 [Vampirovibrionales bacterium]
MIHIQPSYQSPSLNSQRSGVNLKRLPALALAGAVGGIGTHVTQDVLHYRDSVDKLAQSSGAVLCNEAARKAIEEKFNKGKPFYWTVMIKEPTYTDPDRYGFLPIRRIDETNIININPKNKTSGTFWRSTWVPIGTDPNRATYSPPRHYTLDPSEVDKFLKNECQDTNLKDPRVEELPYPSTGVTAVASSEEGDVGFVPTYVDDNNNPIKYGSTQSADPSTSFFEPENMQRQNDSVRIDVPKDTDNQTIPPHRFPIGLTTLTDINSKHIKVLPNGIVMYKNPEGSTMIALPKSSSTEVPVGGD